MEKFFHVYYYNSKYFRADINVRTICGVSNTVMDVTTKKKIEKKGLLMCITRKNWWLKSGNWATSFSDCIAHFPFITSILQPKSV